MKSDIQKHKEKCNQLIDNIAKDLKRDCQFLYKTGAVDLSKYDPEDFVLAKILVTAAMRRNSEEYRPLSESGRKEVKNLERF